MRFKLTNYLRRAVFVLACCLLYGNSSFAQVSIGGIINDYTAVTSLNLPVCDPCDQACVHTITVQDPAAFGPGDKALIIQMKGADIDVTNTAASGDVLNINGAGNYEFFEIENISGNVLTPKYSLIRNYDVAGVVQVVRIPNYGNNVVEVNSTLTADDWSEANGVGGVLALVTDKLVLNADIDLLGKGYQGIQMSVNGTPDNCSRNPNNQYTLPNTAPDSWEKGSGIVVDNTATNRGRGKRANGGGSGVSGDSGGGGGSNYGQGGIGGSRWCDVSGTPAGGIGGLSLVPYLAQDKVFLGGAGGPGWVSTNNPSTAADGGGIVIIFADTIVGNGRIIDVRGTSPVAVNPVGAPDGGGGGGAGGSVVLKTQTYQGNLTVDVSGGNGQTLNTNSYHGPGGGGGGGALLYSLAAIPANVTFTANGGSAGTHLDGFRNGTADGSPGGSVSLYVPIENPNYVAEIDEDNLLSACDIDDDNDGIPDIVEIYKGDHDGDGTPDYADPDFCAATFAGINGWDCADGLPDPTGDLDADGIPNYSDADFPYCSGIVNGVCANFDTDGDGSPDHVDLDADNDGIPDLVEAGGVDTDGDGQVDSNIDADADGLVDIYDDVVGGPSTSTSSDECLNTVGPTHTLTFTVNTLDVGADPSLSLSVFGSYGFDGSTFSLQLEDGTILGPFNRQNSNNTGYADCTNPPMDMNPISIPTASWNTANDDGVVTITMTTSANVDPAFCGVAASCISNVELSYTAVGAAGTAIVNLDTDNDGIPNSIDLDSDNDGIPDVVEVGGTDVDGNGKLDGFTDTDGDGYNDIVDGDVGNDGTAENLAQALQLTGTDGNSDGQPDSYPEGDFDGDGILNIYDLDADNDGIPDIVEAGGTDTDGDGQVDAFADVDGDGFHDPIDGDTNNDGVADNSANALILTGLDANNDGAPDSYPNADVDSDGLLNYLDLDADNDGIADVVEAGGVDADGDGVIDGFNDTDNDGFYDAVDGDVGNDGVAENTAGALVVTGPDGNNDGHPDNYSVADTDGDGLLNAWDLDADNDGIPDLVEAGGADVDGNGQVDNFTDPDADGFSNQYDSDVNNDGVAGDAGTNPLIATGTDAGGDGRPDNYTEGDFDGDGVLNIYDLDADNDGILDVVEAGLAASDANADGQIDDATTNDADGNGWSNTTDGGNSGTTPIGTTDSNNDGYPDSYTTANQDGDNNPNFLDIDADNDGIVDNTEGQSTTGYIAPASNDADGDGIDDAYDNDDANFGGAGSGIPVENTDGTDNPDYLDTDADNDGDLDVLEGHDTNNDGVVDGSDTPNANIGIGGALDADGDGLLDGYDNNTSSVDPTNGGQQGTSHPNTDDPSIQADWRENPLNLDNDNDGVPDLVEAYGGDADGDGTPDYADPDFCAAFFEGVNGWSCANGIPDPDADLDADGIPNYADTDFPTCGGLNPNGSCANFDLDGDGVPNHLDLDNDNDGVPDLVEAGGSDTNGDGTLDNLTDSDGDGLADIVDNDDTDGPEGTSPCVPQTVCLVTSSTSVILDTDGDGTNDNVVDTDGDGVPNYFDLDADNDGVPDVVEAGGTDADGDGFADNFIDVDGDGLSDAIDGDVGNDGTTENTANALQVTGVDGNGDGFADNYPQNDTDGDGIPNHLDLDSDNDGIADVVEYGGVDADGDGFIDGFNDTDADGFYDAVDGDVGNDGIAENTAGALVATGSDGNNDGNPDNYPIADTDGDGLLNAWDLDADNDGIPDLVEAGGADVDGNGQVDNFIDPDADGFSNQYDSDANNDGVAGDAGTNPLIATGTDAGGDGRPDNYTEGDFDGDGVLNIYDLDADNDGILDVVEAGLAASDANADGQIDDATTNDADGNGWSNTTDGGNSGTTPIGTTDSNNDGYPDSYTTANQDGDNNPNFLDIDADNDGIVDNTEGQSTTGYIAPASNDADGDGIDDAYDNDDANFGGAGSGITVENTDGTDNPDYLDLDTDNDGEGDLIEGHDTNGDGVVDGSDSPNANTGIAGAIDADGDGLLDGFDNNTSSTDATNTSLNPNSHPNADAGNAELDWRDPKDNLDQDNDGIPDAMEAYNGDHDGDGIPDYTDPDYCAALFNGVNGWNCADGLPDPDGDLDGDGIPNYADADFPTCGGLNANGTCSNLDLDGDGLPNHLDLDNDNDGIPDLVEVGGEDTNGDGVLDDLTDADGDGLVDAVDNDDTDGPEGTSPCGPQPSCLTANSTSLLFDTDADGNNDRFADTDGDGVPNQFDLDSDNDGIPDVVEAGGTDTDGDGFADNFVDADGDGLHDTVDGDVGNDGTAENTANALQVTGADTNNDGFADSYPSNDVDGDGIPNQLDLDADNDGITDVVEAGGTDTNGDGLADNFSDTDNDGLHDVLDGDVGNDGTAENSTQALILTGNDANNDGTPDNYPNGDVDNDGILNIYDLDADNDGIADVVEAGGTDTNGDGFADNFTDTDNDGLHDVLDGDVGNDGTAENSAQALILTGADNDNNGQPDTYPNGDFDADGILNIYDLDSDNDGVQDILEAGGTDANGDGRVDTFTDTDGDGFANAVDGDPNNDGTADNIAAVLILTGSDNDNDGQPNSYPNANADADATPNFLDLDSDNDGITDVVEAAAGAVTGAANTDSPANGTLDGQIEDGPITDANGDGWSDLQAGAINILDTDGDGVADPYDIDADNDGIPDYLEAVCSTCPTFGTPAGADANGNGVLDTYEGLDAANQTTGANIGATPNEDNNDGTAPVDYLDLDTDNDGGYDWAEGFDNGFGGATPGDGNAADEIVQMAAAYVANGGNAAHYPNTDSDGDGLPDWLDNLNGDGYTNSTAPPFLDPSSPFWIDADNDGLADLFDDNVNGSAFGTGAPTPNNDGLDDNDWRDANTYVDFPIEWLFFEAERQSSSSVLLSWATETERDNRGFEVERMFDYETDFSQIDFVQGQGNSTTINYYSYTDNNSYENLTYYRLRQVDFNGDFEYAEVRAVNNKEAASIDVSVFPNPASNFVNVRFSQLKTTSQVNFKLLDVLGREVFTSSQTVRAGDLITLDAIRNLPAGTYYLNVQIETAQSQLNFEIVKP